MIPLSSGELVSMRGTQDDAMQDTCVRLVWGPGTDAWGNPDLTKTVYTAAASTVACGVEMVNPDELQASSEVPDIDAHIRMPLATTLDAKDRIRVTHRYGEDTTDVEYEIVGPVKRGPTGLVVECRKVLR
jgi:hypothetical protein